MSGIPSPSARKLAESAECVRKSRLSPENPPQYEGDAPHAIYIVYFRVKGLGTAFQRVGVSELLERECPELIERFARDGLQELIQERLDERN